MFPFKKVLVLTQYFKPEMGAPQIRLLQFCKILQSQGIEVQVLTGMPNYPDGVIHEKYRNKIFKSEIVDGIRVKRTYLFPATGRRPFMRLLNYFSFMVSCFIPLMFSRKPDLVFVEAQPIILAIPALIFNYLKKVPYIYNTPDLQIEYADQNKWIKSRNFIKASKRLESFLMKRSLSITTVTHAFIKHFSEERNILLQKFSFLPNGADVDFLKPISKDFELIKKFKVENKIIFSYVGTHAPYQGLDTIIYAAKLLVDRTDIVILMIGNGPERKKLKELAKNMKLNNIYFLQSPYSEMPSLMSITYASIVTLRDMPISRKMRLSKAIPPLACGVPVLYAGYGETLDLLIKYKSGISVKPENPKDLALKIIFLANNPDLRNELGLNSRKLSLSQFSWEKIITDWQKQISAIKKNEDPIIENFN